MAIGVEFDGANRHMGAPKEMHEEQVYTLPVMLAEDQDLPIQGSGGKFHAVAVSRWQFSPEEMVELNRNGGVTYLKVIGGQPACNICAFPYENLDSSQFDKNPS